MIGIGAYDVQTLAPKGYSGRGAADDGRYKPDLQLPTDTETASSGSRHDARLFGGTSARDPVSRRRGPR